MTTDYERGWRDGVEAALATGAADRLEEEARVHEGRAVRALASGFPPDHHNAVADSLRSPARALRSLAPPPAPPARDVTECDRCPFCTADMGERYEKHDPGCELRRLALLLPPPAPPAEDARFCKESACTECGGTGYAFGGNRCEWCEPWGNGRTP